MLLHSIAMGLLIIMVTGGISIPIMLLIICFLIRLIFIINYINILSIR